MPMMDSVEAHKFELRFFPINVFTIFNGENIDDIVIRVALFKDGEHTGIGNEIFASKREYPENLTWYLSKEQRDKVEE